MKLLFDIGNSHTKAASFVAGELRPLATGANNAELPLDAWAAVGSPQSILVSSVADGRITQLIAEWAEDAWGIEVELATLKQGVGGVTTRYNNPQQLGIDRWLAALAGFELGGRASDVCVIDAGTALTVDIVDHSGVHHGGLIAPGLNLMIESLTQQTAQLALEDLTIPESFALDTQSAISLGCAEYIAGMMERVQHKLSEMEMSSVRWFVTGGQASVVDVLSPFSLEVVPELVLQGIAILAEDDA